MIMATPRLRDHPDDLAALIHRAAEARGLVESYVEKDFWVTEVLRAAVRPREVALLDGSTAPVVFIFKGGTSLSRVFGIVDRFSEDVDLLAVFPPEAAVTARHRVFRRVDADVAAHLGLSRAQVRVGPSTTGVKRYTTYLHPTDVAGVDLKEGVLLELGSRGGAHPHSSRLFQSIVAGHAIAELGEDDHTWAEFVPFEVEVLAPERTLLEKVAAVHDAAARNDTARLHRYGRHFYDIDRLLNTPSVIAALTALGPEGIASLVVDIDGHSDDAGFTWTPRPTGGYADSPAFDPAHPSRTAITIGFQNAQSLIHGQRVGLAQIDATVAIHRSLL